MKLAHDAVQISKDVSRQKIVERLIKKTQDGTCGQKTDEPMDDGEGDAVNVGNQYTITIPPEPPPPPVPPSPPSFAKTAGAAAALVAALGLGAAAPIAAWNLSKPKQVESAEDTNTKYQVRIYRDE